MNTILSQGNDLLIHLYVQFSCVLISRTLKKLLLILFFGGRHLSFICQSTGGLLCFSVLL